MSGRITMDPGGLHTRFFCSFGARLPNSGWCASERILGLVAGIDHFLSPYHVTQEISLQILTIKLQKDSQRLRTCISITLTETEKRCRSGPEVLCFVSKLSCRRSDCVTDSALSR